MEEILRKQIVELEKLLALKDQRIAQLEYKATPWGWGYPTTHPYNPFWTITASGDTTAINLQRDQNYG